MAAVLIAVVVALVAGHALPRLARLRRFDLFAGWLSWLEQRDFLSSVMDSRFSVLLGIGIPMALTAAMQTALRGVWFGLPHFAFSVLVLFYCWGPRDLDLDVQSVVDAEGRDQRRSAACQLLGREDSAGVGVCAGGPMVEGVFRSALSRWFGVLFWFLLLGPMGAVLYRLARLAGQGELNARLRPFHAASARRLSDILDWPVAQLMTLSLGLVGNLDAVIRAWRAWYAPPERHFLSLDTGFLGPVARVSVDTELAEDEAYDPEHGEEAPPLLELKDAMSMIWRMLILWLTVLALFVLAGVVN